MEENTSNQVETEGAWVLSVDISSNLRGSDARVKLEGLDIVLLELSLGFGRKASDN